MWLQGVCLDLESGNTEKWCVGVVRVGPATLWATLEDTLTSLVLDHWQSLQR